MQTKTLSTLGVLQDIFQATFVTYLHPAYEYQENHLLDLHSPEIF